MDEADLAILNARTLSEDIWTVALSRLEDNKRELETNSYDSAEAILKKLLKYEFPKES